MPTLADVAKKAGVSTATVSKVLSNTPYFTEMTRVKVMNAVEELGYVPHLAARALSSGKTHIIAVVFPNVFDTIFTDPLVLRILEGIEAECHAYGYNVLLSTPRLTRNRPDNHYQQLLTSGYIDGIIALDHFPSVSVIEPATKRGIPSVAIGHYPTTYQVQSDDYSGGWQLMQHIISLGHQQIGIIGVPEKSHYSIQHRLNGLKDSAQQSNLYFDDFPYSDGDFSEASGSKCAAKLLSKSPDLTAIICVNDRMAMGAIQYAREIGRDVPKSLSVVGYDNIPMAAAFFPPLTTVDQQAGDLGRAAARMLFEVLSERQPAPVKVPTYLVIRQSSATA